jgi:hypothetical protein
MRLFWLAAGIATGYAIQRYLDAKAEGIDRALVFRSDNIFKPVRQVLYNTGSAAEILAADQRAGFSSLPQIVQPITPTPAATNGWGYWQ